MERLRTEQPKGLSRSGLRKWGMLLVILGIFGRSVLQTRYLGITQITGEQLLAVMEASPGAMVAATVAIVMQFVETCAAPIFCLLLADGFAHTSNSSKYFTRILTFAVVSEIPYNFAMSGNLLDMSSRNPVFGMVISMILLYLYDHFSGKKVVSLLINVGVTFAALIWCRMLSIEYGACCVILTAVFWGFRRKPNLRNLMGGAAAMVCSLFSLFFMASPMGMLIIHFYNGEKDEENRMISYLFYPAALVLIGIAGALAF